MKDIGVNYKYHSKFQNTFFNSVQIFAELPESTKAQFINLHEGNIAALKEIHPITTMYKEVTNLLLKITLQMSVGKHFFWHMEMQ